MASSGQCGPHITTPSLPAGNDDGIHPFPAMEFNPTEVPRSAPMAAASVAAAASAVSPPHGHSVEEVQGKTRASEDEQLSGQSEARFLCCLSVLFCAKHCEETGIYPVLLRSKNHKSSRVSSS